MYSAVFDLSKVRDVPDDFSRFEFGFQVIAPSFEFLDRGLHVPVVASPEYIQYNGTILTSDVESPQQIEKLLSVSYDGKDQTVAWEHFPDEKEYRFSIDSLLRGEQENSILLKWNGAAIGNDETYENENIPDRKSDV